MPQQVGIEMADDVDARLLAIPSAVTPSERRLALHYLAAYWDGTGDVFENGPLLGGATRALGMGMLLNEKRDPDSRIYTYDWFSFRDNNPLDLAPDTFEILADMGRLTREQVELARSQGSFQPLYVALHEREDYWPLVRASVGYLPGHRGDVPPEGEGGVFRDPTGWYSIAFVDGCKSWYGTKHWFREIVPHLRPGADLMFQDYGHYTCFWIPMLIAEFRERFEKIAWVDRTYVWRVHDPPTAEDVEIAFPDEPDGYTREAYDEAFDWLGEEAAKQGDRYAAMIHQFHRAAAYAYIGLKDEAIATIDPLLMLSEWLPLREYLKAARVSPTYTPEGQILL